MSLHTVRSFRRFVTGLRAVSVVEQWGSHVAKVGGQEGGKVFALIGGESEAIVFKVNEMAFEGLTGLEGIEQAPYFAKRQWVSVGKGAPLSDAELKAYIRASYDTIARKLTRKARAELGISVE